MDEILNAPLHTVSQRLAEGEFSARELTAATLARIERLEPYLHSYATVLAQQALEAADLIDRRRMSGQDLGPLHGIPLGLKDIIAAAGAPTHIGSVALRNWSPGADSTVARRLRAAGAILIGKHQTTEGACGDHHPSLPTPVNPWNPHAWTGVSSSGSAVATAAGLSFGSFGSDTGGSIRFPAHCCGLVGLKPTWGRVSRHGVFPLAESLDHVGPIARTVEDVAILYATVAGYDPLDKTTLHAAVPTWSPPRTDKLTLRVGLDEAYCSVDVDTRVTRCLRRAAGILGDAGAEIVTVDVPRLGEMVSDWLVLCAHEAVAAHAATYPAQKAEYGPAIAALLEYGRRLDADAVSKAVQQRRHFVASHNALLDQVDMYLSPTFHHLTPTLSEAKQQMRGAGLRQFVAFTAPANLCGCPTLSLPGGCDSSGTPYGYQLVGRALGETELLLAGLTIERSSSWSGSAVPFETLQVRLASGNP